MGQDSSQTGQADYYLAQVFSASLLVDRTIVFGKMDQFNENQQLGRLAHELKHAYQYETGKLSFSLGGSISAYDATDEVEAYERQRDLGLGISSNKDISVEKIKQDRRYSHLPEGPINVATDPSIYLGTYSAGQKYRYNESRKNENSSKEIPAMYKGWQIYFKQGYERRPFKF